MKAATEVSTKAENQAYLAALERLFAPIARLMIAHRIGYPALEAILQRVYIQSARRYFCPEGVRATASRLYMLTGIHRKKITALAESDLRAQPVAPVSLVQQVLDHLSSSPRFMNESGVLNPLPMSRKKGGELSFEAIVEEVSKDVRPKAVLDQLVEAEIAHIDGNGLIHIAVLSSRKPTMLRSDGAMPIERALVPITKTLVANLLTPGNETAVLYVRVAGLSDANARALKREFLTQMSDVLMDLNQRAETQAKLDLSDGSARTTLYVGTYGLVDDLVPPKN
jgi:Family of unknown function (DUF6502)